MSSEAHSVGGWLLHPYPDLRCKSAFLKSGYALRSCVGVGLFAICHAIFQHESDGRGGNFTLLQWSQGCLWGAITVITVNFPIMGRIAKQSFERALSTVVGGWLGYAAYIVSQHPSVEIWAQCWTAVISVLFAFAALLMGVKLKLDYSAKLLGVTFVLVLWTPQSEEQALDVAASRISCIVIGVLVMAVLSILIYPQIASELVLGEMHSAMQSIADFNEASTCGATRARASQMCRPAAWSNQKGPAQVLTRSPQCARARMTARELMAIAQQVLKNL
ncbi:g2439 [Coccomyxa viridis]|uniref:G2439 protein n=1 Tax=Coccomyxa viridis TaxID=1274662 RepID=A0ABP1FKE1_9CHLO